MGVDNIPLNGWSLLLVFPLMFYGCNHDNLTVCYYKKLTFKGYYNLKINLN